jgi:hypothetical protein
MCFQLNWTFWFLGILEMQSGNEWQCGASNCLLKSNVEIWTSWVGLRVVNIQFVRLGNNISCRPVQDRRICRHVISQEKPKTRFNLHKVAFGSNFRSVSAVLNSCQLKGAFAYYCEIACPAYTTILLWTLEITSALLLHREYTFCDSPECLILSANEFSYCSLPSSVLVRG